MTDTLFDVEEVKTNPIIDALRLPFNAQICREVRRFGFEYEMFEGNDDCEITSDTVWSSDHDPCNCTDCLDDRLREARREAAANGNVGALISRAYEAALVASRQQHDYHCHRNTGCRTCDHRRSHPLLTAQTDGTCGVEFVSRIIDLNDFVQAREDIDTWVEVMQSWKDDDNWMPDGEAYNGNHVHVSKAGDDHGFEYYDQSSSARHINAIFAAFDWTDVAHGGCGEIRPYNQKPGIYGSGGSWLSDRGYGTHELRLWNTPRDPERLWGHLGLSIAIVRWAFAISTGCPEFAFWTNGRMDDGTYQTLTNNLGDVITGIRSYIPELSCFDIAHDLITKLTT